MGPGERVDGPDDYFGGTGGGHVVLGCPDDACGPWGCEPWGGSGDPGDGPDDPGPSGPGIDSRGHRHVRVVLESFLMAWSWGPGDGSCSHRGIAIIMGMVLVVLGVVLVSWWSWCWFWCSLGIALVVLRCSGGPRGDSVDLGGGAGDLRDGACGPGRGSGGPGIVPVVLLMVLMVLRILLATLGMVSVISLFLIRINILSCPEEAGSKNIPWMTATTNSDAW